MNLSETIERAAPTLVRVGDNLWRAATGSAVSYPDDAHSAINEIEARSYWFNHRNACINAVMDRFAFDGPLLDIGGGNGYVSLGLSMAGRIGVVLEPGADGAQNAIRRGLPVIQSTLSDAAICDGAFRAAGMFDVLEHIEDAASALGEVNRILVAGGLFYLTVPAHGVLWSSEDVAAGHFRRYGVSGLRTALESSGFELEFASYLFGVLTPAIFLLRSLPSGFGKFSNSAGAAGVEGDHTLPKGVIGDLIQASLDRELKILKGGGALALGSSILAVARKSA